MEELNLDTIECGIGKIEYTADNLLLNDLMENLSSLIQKHGAKKINDLLNKKPSEELEKEIDNLNDELKLKDNQISDLQNELYPDEELGTTIDFGIGTINYEADNLLLNDLMENLGLAISKTSPKKVNEIIAAIS